MSRRKNALKLVHFASTAWFMLCVGYILVLALRQAGFRWWLIFSLSGHSALLIFLLISLYLFAIFRGVGRSQKIEVEHPLTSTNYYTAFYVSAPLLGALAGCLGMIGESRAGQFLLGIALGTLGTTFLVWIIIDLALGLLEMLLPESRKHRLERLAQAKALRQERQEQRKQLLAKILAQNGREQHRWQEALKPQAEKLAGLLATDRTDLKETEREAVDIGINAWQIGGLSCMQELRNMAIAICRQSSQSRNIVDYIPVWWDGIGSWRGSLLC